MLCERAWNYGSADNITCLVIYFTHHTDEWDRTPHRSPDELLRLPYRVDASCQTLTSMDVPEGGDPPESGPEGKSLSSDEPNDRLQDSAVELAQRPDGGSSQELPAKGRSSKSRSKSRRKSKSKSKSGSRPHQPTARKSSRSVSYNRSRSKNDSRNGYRFDPVTEVEKSVEEEKPVEVEKSVVETQPSDGTDAKTSSPLLATTDDVRELETEASLHSSPATKSHQREHTEPAPSSLPPAENPSSSAPLSPPVKESLTLPVPVDTDDSNSPSVQLLKDSPDAASSEDLADSDS